MDIVEHLRRFARNEIVDFHTMKRRDAGHAPEATRLASDAAAEITRLRAELAEARRYSSSLMAMVSDANAERDAGVARAERMEAALRQIAEGNLGDAPWQAGFQRIKQVARTALQEPRHE